MNKLTARSASLASIVGAAALLSSTAIVNAQEPEVYTTYEERNWSGFALGLYAGAGMTDPTLNPDQRLQDRFESPAVGAVTLISPDADFAFELDDNGAMISGGGSLGYFRQFGIFVLGVEADIGSVYSESEKENALATTVHYNNHDITVLDPNQTSEADRAERYSSSLTMDSEASVRGTLGVALGRRVMLFGTGGWAAAKVDGDLNYTSRTDYFHDDADNDNDETDGDIIRHTSSAADNWSEWVDGWTAGGGVEFLVNERVSFGFEYRYADYGKQSRTVAVDRTATRIANATRTGAAMTAAQLPNTDPESITVEEELTTHAVRATVKIRFGR